MKIAFILRGAISNKIGPISVDNIPSKADLVDFYLCYESIKKFILEPNRNHDIDIFIHSWTLDAEEDLVDLYKPNAYKFENNSIYDGFIKSLGGEYAQASQGVAFSKSIELVEQYVTNNINKSYDMVILYRPDILLWKEMKFDFYKDVCSSNIIYVNAHPDCNGDFHFVMDWKRALEFKNIIFSGIPPKTHWWIKEYITNHMKCELLMDNIVPAQSQEVLRKLESFVPNHSEVLKKIKEFNSLA